VIEELAGAAIPHLADGCIVDVVTDGEIKRLLTKHHSSETESLLQELQKRFPPLRGSPQPSARVMRSGKPELLRILDPSAIRSHTFNEEHASLIGQIGIRSHIAVPLHIRGKIIGAISLFITTDRDPFDDEDLTTCLELARRTALAIDNARLFRDAQHAISQRDEFISIASHELGIIVDVDAEEPIILNCDPFRIEPEKGTTFLVDLPIEKAIS